MSCIFQEIFLIHFWKSAVFFTRAFINNKLQIIWEKGQRNYRNSWQKTYFLIETYKNILRLVQANSFV